MVHAPIFSLPSVAAEESAENGDKDIERIENFQKESHVPRSTWFSFFDEGVFDWELDQDDQGT